MPKFTPEQNEQYYRVRLDPFKLRHSKGMEYRAICPLHGGSNPSQLWVNLAEGNFFCFSCQAKGGSAYTFEQELLKAQHPNGIAPSNDQIVASLEAVMGTPFVQRTYATPVSVDGKGWIVSRQETATCTRTRTVRKCSRCGASWTERATK